MRQETNLRSSNRRRCSLLYGIWVTCIEESIEDEENSIWQNIGDLDPISRRLRLRRLEFELLVVVLIMLLLHLRYFVDIESK